MKKIIKSRSESLEPSRLYLEDIEDILESFSKVTDDIIITTTDYELSGIDDFKKINEECLTELKISSSKPYISLDFTKSDTRIYISEDVPESRGIFEEIKEIIQSRRNKSSRIIQSPTLSGAIIGFSFWFILPAVMNMRYKGTVLEDVNDNNGLLLGTGILVLVFGIIHSKWTLDIRIKKHSVIYLRRKSESPSFFRRNQDQIIIATFSAIVGAIIGGIIIALALG